jgi:hypothetical protein
MTAYEAVGLWVRPNSISIAANLKALSLWDSDRYRLVRLLACLPRC